MYLIMIQQIYTQINKHPNKKAPQLRGIKNIKTDKQMKSKNQKTKQSS